MPSWSFAPWLLLAASGAALALSAMGAPGAPALDSDDPANRGPGHPERPSEAVYPPQRLALHFDHARHVGEVGLSCVYCHTGAATSRSAADRLLASPTRCDACHGTDHRRLDRVTAGTRPAEACSYCHAGHTAADGNHVTRTVIPPPNLKFDHAEHHALGLPCGDCHAGVAEAGIATSMHLPRMQKCLECHTSSPGSPKDPPEARTATGACDACHITETGSRLVTTFPTGQLLPAKWMGDVEHGPDWLHRHRDVAGANSAACATCHEESECVDCHDGRVRPRSVHPGDWLSSHAVATRMTDPTCGSCHRAQSFCVSCHERAGVAMSGPLGTLAGRGRFHPPEGVWTGRPATSRHHSWEAQRNITACVSCHTERDCASCHATSARGGPGDLSPHPPGFASSCAHALSRNARPCLFCHEASDRSLDRCR